MPHHLPLLAMKQGAPTAMLNEDAEEQDRAFHHERFSQFMRNSPRQTDNPNDFTRHCYQRYIVNSGDLGFRRLQNHKATIQLCLRWYSHQYQDIPRELQLLPDLLSRTMRLWEHPFAHTWMQAFVDMQTDPEKAVAFRQAIIQSNGRTLAFMARAIDEHSCDTIKSSPHRMYRNRNDKRLGLEFQKTWKNNFNSPNVCMDHIRYRRWPFQDSRFQQFYAEMPYPAELGSKHNPFGYEVWDYHLEEVRNDAGQPLEAVHCFMYFYRYNFARALLNLVEHAFVGEAEDQFPTFGEFVQSALGKHIQFVLLNELTMTRVIRDDHPNHVWFDNHINAAGPTWNYAAKFLVKAFTTDEDTKQAYAATEALDWPLRLNEFLDNTQDVKTMFPLYDSNYIWIITVPKFPDRYHPIFNADYELLYLFCKEAYRHVVGDLESGVNTYYEEGGWGLIKKYKHPDTSEVDTLPLYTHVVFESIHWLCEESLDPGDIRAIMRTPIPEKTKDSELTQEQVENAEFFYNWINMIQELVKDEVEPYAEARGPEAVRTRSKQYYSKPQRKNPKFNPKLRQKLDALNSAYERPFTLVARYRMATDQNELFESLADDGLEGGFIDEIEDSRLLQHIKRQRTAAAMLTNGLLSKMCELKL